LRVRESLLSRSGVLLKLSRVLLKVRRVLLSFSKWVLKLKRLGMSERTEFLGWRRFDPAFATAGLAAGRLRRGRRSYWRGRRSYYSR